MGEMTLLELSMREWFINETHKNTIFKQSLIEKGPIVLKDSSISRSLQCCYLFICLLL
jgi:hypothetical protein